MAGYQIKTEAEFVRLVEGGRNQRDDWELPLWKFAQGAGVGQVEEMPQASEAREVKHG